MGENDQPPTQGPNNRELLSGLERTPVTPTPTPIPATPAPIVPPAFPYAESPTGRGKNGLGTAALVLGIIGLAGGWFLPGTGVAALLAVIFGVIGIQRANRGEASNKTIALWGMWLGIAGIAISVFAWIAVGILMVASN